ncbi:hypothetical protein EB796_008546 [Bugula neritina]|uniref:lysozyme n=1 Tax=Bugula neritina TaxID=10212 RepID=A0A7J7K6B9_BUGNE|nr:hypothetical protein EB796_022237 [Bugula neritina]KAF6033116.1 hypothetical protein EB796_008546 [Bugula neritina]
MIKLHSLIILCLTVGLVTSSLLTDECLSCLRQKKKGDKTCRWNWGNKSCGTYHITKEFWLAAYERGYSYETCTKDDFCAELTMMSYFRRYGERCAKQLNKQTYQLTCGDYIRLHDGGPDGCSKFSTINASRSINMCMSR